MARKKSRKRTRSRRLTLKIGVAVVVALVAWAIAGVWYVHHPRAWLVQNRERWPRFLTAPLLWIGNPVGDLTDALDWTGHDAVYEYDSDAPEGSVLFAGAPRRVGAPAPDDIRILDRGEFLVGWSDRLRHPVWCAYHVTRQAKFDVGARPVFRKDRSVTAAPSPNDYTRSGYDRGHMVPNYAIVTRFGEEARRRTFLMTNIAPQTPALNRGVWRELEHRIADLWTARYGELWVVVGCISSGGETVSGTDIDVPRAFYQVILAQEGMDVRALATVFSQDVEWGEWAARHIVSVDELETMTGLDFNPDLPPFIQDPLEADLPTRLWPIRFRDLLSMVALRFM